MTSRDIALDLRSAGLSVIPIKVDATKSPVCRWKRFQTEIPTVQSVQRMFGGHVGIGIVCGAVSGGLEVLDVEKEGPFDELHHMISSVDASLIDLLPRVKTPSGGYHLFYRCDQIERSMKLAMKRLSGSEKTLIETRGEGAYVVTIGSPAECHKDRREYTLINGSLQKIPQINSTQRDLLLNCSRSFNEMQKEASRLAFTRSVGSKGRPGDEFNRLATWQQILEPHLWRACGYSAETRWTRPGKESGPSATTNYHGSDLLYVFSTNAPPFEAGRSYSKFAAYALLEHDGDFSRAAAAIAKMGTSLETGMSNVRVDDVLFTPPKHWQKYDLATRSDWGCEPLRPIVDGILARGNLASVVGSSQTGKTLLSLYLGQKLLHAGMLFDRYQITPVNRVLYLALEDPARRIHERLRDMQFEFPEVEPLRFQVMTAPEFHLSNDRMFGWLEQLVEKEKTDVLFIDTYQKSTPGISSFDDEAQGPIVHRLANLTRRLGITIIVLDHVRKSTEGRRGKRQLSLDDVKGSGTKVQNADCVILLDRYGDRKLRLQAFSKDFDTPVQFVLDVAAHGSGRPKFSLATIQQDQSDNRAVAQMTAVFDAMPNGVWISVPTIAKSVPYGTTTIQSYVKKLVEEKRAESNGKPGKQRLYRRCVIGGDMKQVAI